MGCDLETLYKVNTEAIASEVEEKFVAKAKAKIEVKPAAKPKKAA